MMTLESGTELVHDRLTTEIGAAAVRVESAEIERADARAVV